MSPLPHESVLHGAAVAQGAVVIDEASEEGMGESSDSASAKMLIEEAGKWRVEYATGALPELTVWARRQESSIMEP